MRRSLFLLAACILALAALPARAQVGKHVPLHAGTPEDKAFVEISATSDPTQKLRLIDKFLADYGQGDMALIAYELYIQVYLAQKNYDKVFEYGEKTLAIDPDNFNIAVTMFRAAQEKGDPQKMFAVGGTVAGILASFKARPAPDGKDSSTWEAEKSLVLNQLQDNINYVDSTLFSIAYQTQDPMARAALLERYAATFPDSQYANQALSMVVAAYQQANNVPKMIGASRKALAANPENPGILILLADHWSEQGQELDAAEQNARKAIEILSTMPRPEGITDEQWAQQKSLQTGLAWSAIGQTLIHRKRDAQAVDAFRAAAPLLKPAAVTYARNQYRLGFALINLKRLSEARVAFMEAASVESPYRALAQEKMKGLPASSPAKKSPPRKGA
ncbi:MAG TPA: hypothetical protein VI699_11430 [Candidatus Acidoferrales bacterium]|nr:hypothetical protein [Candidatus Acidoferrales bacterium]